ncbi:MAG: Do family serine endopeptidase [Campylobacterales bacterium]|nr:Do family serine endopeptidase [Campylobacterales bacterium]
MKRAIILSSMLALSLYAIDLKDAPRDFNRVMPENGAVLSYYEAIKDAKNCVVNISTKKTIKQKGLDMDLNQLPPLFREFFGKDFPFNMQNMPKNRVQNSLGSGVIVSKDGYIITNNHVVENSDEIIVTLSNDTKEYKAKLIGSDPKSDLAVIKIDKKEVDYIKFADSSLLKEGDIVFAIGNPFGIGESVTQGIISAIGKSGMGINEYENFIQTDASINPGNSGGALVDSRGALVGINTAIITKSGGNDGVGFAIPANMVKNIAKSLIEEGKVERGFLGVSIGDLSEDLKDFYINKSGAFVLDVGEDTPASRAKLQRGDLIITIDGQSVKSSSELKNIIGSKKPNENIEIEYERNKKIHKTSLKLDSQEKSQSAGMFVDDIVSGLEIQNLNDNLRQKLNLPKVSKGVVVTNVKDSSTASELGFMVGDLIIQVDTIAVNNISDFKNAMKESGGKKIVYIQRKGIVYALVIK